MDNHASLVDWFGRVLFRRTFLCDKVIRLGTDGNYFNHGSFQFYVSLVVVAAADFDFILCCPKKTDHPGHDYYFVVGDRFGFIYPKSKFERNGNRHDIGI